MNYPKISIVTPSFNQGQYLEETILSVINQGYPDLEYIIIDGGSTDDSVAIIRKYEEELHYWVSEKDDGQADAINKGLQHCTGEIFNWINSDDLLAEGALLKIATVFQAAGTTMVAGAVINFNEQGQETPIQNRHISLEHYFSKEGNYVYHQPGIWLRTGLVKTTGLFNTKLHYCFDQEHLLRYLLRYPHVVYIRDMLVHFRIHGASKTTTQFKFFYLELLQIYQWFYRAHPKHHVATAARRKSREFNWTAMHQDLKGGGYSRLQVIFKVSLAILRDPARRLNLKNLGWLKHILLRE